MMTEKTKPKRKRALCTHPGCENIAKAKKLCARHYLQQQRQTAKTGGKSWQNDEMQNIFDMWDYHLFQKLEDVDRIVRLMFSEMARIGIPKTVYVPYLQEKLADMIQQISEQGNG